MSARMRVTRAHTGNRRSHHALKEPRLSTCAKCNAQHLRHRMCPECGSYRGREVVDVVGQKAARTVRRNARLKAMGEDPQADDETQSQKVEVKAEKKAASKGSSVAMEKAKKTTKKI
ncbi:MAG: 50S ribosomal protein L32 [Candidatus Pacebacteria bacterium]|nr:50S ribosomal protein L32 [Candidatus Paceibacterota bacterium]